jgi:hypothetical protein
MNLQDLAAPFPSADVEWRIQSAGVKGDKVWARCLAYITSRAVMQRLDDVCGPENWRNEYMFGPNNAVLCGIAIKVLFNANGSEWVTKWDGAENTDVEAVKGGLSSAMKRTAVQWGIGRYLYDLDEGFANVHENGKHYAGKNEKKGTPAFKWDPPPLPAWALPQSSAAAPPRQPKPQGAPSPTPKAASPADRLVGGKRLGDLSDAKLEEVLLWAREKGKADIEADCETLLEARNPVDHVHDDSGADGGGWGT